MKQKYILLVLVAILALVLAGCAGTSGGGSTTYDVTVEITQWLSWEEGSENPVEAFAYTLATGGTAHIVSGSGQDVEITLLGAGAETAKIETSQPMFPETGDGMAAEFTLLYGQPLVLWEVSAQQEFSYTIVVSPKGQE